MKIISLITLAFVLSLVFSKSFNKSGVCDLPMVKGPCKANVKRFYYNTTSKKCEEFIYSGCHGNRNNFLMIEGCKYECEPKKSVI